MNNKFGILTALLCFGMAFTQEVYSTWGHYSEININTTGGGANVANAVTKFPVLVRLTSANGSVFTQAAANGSDIRFTKTDGTTRLPHQRERWDAVNQVAEFWVLVDAVAGNDSTMMRMYWEKSGAADLSNGGQVFDTAYGFRSAWHLGDTTGVAPRPNAVTPYASLRATPVNFLAATGSYSPIQGVIGLADTLLGGRNGGLTNNGLSRYMTVDSGTSTDAYRFPGGKFTVSLWANSSRFAANCRHFHLQSNPIGAADPASALQTIPSSTGPASLYFRYSTGPAGTNTYQGGNAGGNVLAANTWQHITGVVSRGGATDTIIKYVNGVEYNRVTTTTQMPDSIRKYVFLGRAFESASDSGFAGSLDEIVFSNATRSPAWIKLSYETQKPGATCVTVGSPVNNTPTAPSGLSYSTNPAIYTVGTAITNNTPTVTGTVIAYAVNPALPAGLTLSTATGVITGTPTAAAATASYVVTASNGGGSTTASLSITVNAAAPANLTYSVNPATYVVGTLINDNTPSTTGGTPTGYSTTPALPAGLALNTATGVISGTPTTATAAAGYIITATNATGSTTVTLNITVSSVVVAPANLTYSPNPATYGINVAIAANNPAYTGGAPTSFSVAPALPAGLVLSTATGAVTGTPTAAQAAASYVITAANGAGSTSASLSIAVMAAPSGLTYSANPATYGMGAAITPNSPTVTGTVTAYAVSPTLPTGLTLNTTTGVISGTPTTAQASANYTVTATNAGGSTTATLSITVLVVPSGLTYSQPTSTDTVGQAIPPNTPTVSGSVTSYTVSPTLPAGLSISATTGVISGTPVTATGSATYTVTASNAAGSTTAALNITVVAAVGVNWKAGFSDRFVIRLSGASALSFTLPSAGAAQIRFTMTDMRGRIVWSRNVELKSMAARELSWGGAGAPAGLYLIRMTALDAKQREIQVVEKKMAYTP